jgi:hypothetical protein
MIAEDKSMGSPMEERERLLKQVRKKVHYLFLFCFICFIWVFETVFSLCGPGCPGICSIDQAGFELRDLFASVSQVLVLMMDATTAWPFICFKSYELSKKSM